MSDQEPISVLADPVEKISCRKCGAHLDVSRLPSFSVVECPQCRLKQMVPALLGQFLLLELLGAGGMGAVYKALDQALGRYVAIKVMKRAMGEDPQFVENFLREARAAAAINHRNVVQIYSCGQEKGQPYLVMELVSGGRLDEWIAKGEPIEEARVLEIGVDIAQGLQAAHDIGLIHGDIKPANILFDKEQTAKVADFGLARFIAWQQNRGEVWGTPYYIAPEKARGQKEDHRSDIYSLGATLYHALGAKPPFDGKTATDVVLARLKNPAIGIRVIRPSLQPETADVIGRMLEADPFMRYPTYASLLADLREALRVAKQEARGLHRKVKKTSLAPAVALVAGLVLLIALLVGLTYRVLTRHEEKPAPPPAVPPTMRLEAGRPSAPAVPSGPSTAPAPKLPAPEAPSPEIAAEPVTNPFPADLEPAVLAAAQQLVEGKADVMRRQLEKLREKIPAGRPALYWLRLLEGVGALAGGQDDEARIIWKDLRNELIEVRPDVPNLNALAQLMARYLLIEADEAAVRTEAQKWPPYYADLVELFSGLRALRAGELEKGASAFKTYAEKQAAEPAWPYSLQPAARAWIPQAEEFLAQKKTLQDLLAAGQATRVRAAWEEFRRKTSPLWYAAVEAEIGATRKAEATEAAERQRAEQQAYGEKIQQDLDRLDAARGANLNLVAQKDYRKALINLNRLITEIKTPEGQKTLVNIREMYERMDNLKKFLIAQLNASPFPGQSRSDLGGRTAGADALGIKVALGQHGEMVRPWEQISAQTYLLLATHYLEGASLSKEEKAELLVSTAVFCYENGGFRPAAGYADQAAKLNPAVKTKIRILMPDLLAE